VSHNNVTRWLYCLECPQYSIRLEGVRYLCKYVYFLFLFHVGQPRSTAAYLPKIWVGFLYGAYIQDFKLILTVKMESRHPIKWSFGSEFPAMCNHCVGLAALAAWSRKTLKFCVTFLRFFCGKATPYAKIFKIWFRKFSSRHRSTFLCSNVVKFVRREMGEIVRYLVDKKQHFAYFSNCR